jgi:N-acyl-D-amino-acid deacylase
MYAPTEELVALAGVVARHGGHYATHARVSVDAPLEAIDEAAQIGRESGARVQFSHVAINDPARWGQHGEHLARFESHRAAGVDIAYDVYPYAASSSNLTQYLPAWVQEGGTDAMAARLADRATRERALADVEKGWYGGIPWLWDRVVVGIDPIEPDNAGKSLQSLAAEHGIAPEELTLRLCETRGNAITVVLFYRTEEDMQAFLKHPLSTIGSDGLAYPLDQGDARPHPRSFGTHPRVLGRYVRELGTLPLADAVHTSTGRAAGRMGIQDRGLLREGLAADVVLFDPATVADRATFEDPAQRPVGIRHVIVNGAIVVQDGQQTSARPGRVLRRGDRLPVV